MGRGRRCFSKNTEASSSYANGTGENPYVPVNTKLSDARVIYAVAPAMGHNQVYSILSWAPFLFLSFWPCFAGDVYFVRLFSCKSCLRHLFFSFDGCFLHPYHGFTLYFFMPLIIVSTYYCWQESHPESHFRVPAIVQALDKLELTPKVLFTVLDICHELERPQSIINFWCLSNLESKTEEYLIFVK